MGNASVRLEPGTGQAMPLTMAARGTALGPEKKGVRGGLGVGSLDVMPRTGPRFEGVGRPGQRLLWVADRFLPRLLKTQRALPRPKNSVDPYIFL